MDIKINKILNYALITVMCLGLFAFFLPNMVVTAPIIGKMKVSMYDVFFSTITSGTTVATHEPDPLNILYTEMSFGSILCFLSILGIIVHYMLSIFWGYAYFITKNVKRFLFLDEIWLISAIQFPVLFTIGGSIVMSALRRSVMEEDTGGFKGLAVAMISNVSIDAGIIMWILALTALCSLILMKIIPKDVISQSQEAVKDTSCRFLNCACGQEMGIPKEMLEKLDGQECSCPRCNQTIPNETILSLFKNT